MKKIGLVFCCLFSIGILSGQSISFFKETLSFKLNRDSFEVDGLYYFRNHTNTEIRQVMFYPFPDVEQYGKIKSIEIKTEGDTASQILSISEKGALFRLFMDPNSEVIYHIRYSQFLQSNQAKYIITTTRKWGEGFEQADYNMEFTEAIEIDSVTIKPDSIVQKQNLTKYFWHRENFMPEVDFIFWFSQN